jgi:hypothetical protein
MMKKMETLKCFNCNIHKPLVKYKPNNRVYQTKSSKGMCLVCKLCSFTEALNKLSVVRYDYDKLTFVVINFKNKCEVVEFFENEQGEL